MGLEKIGTAISKEIIAWTHTGTSKNLLATAPVKIHLGELRYSPYPKKLTSDIFQPSQKHLCKNAEDINKMQQNACLLTCKTFGKLFSAEFTPRHRITKEGFPVTTIIDKTTDKPIEAFFKRTTSVKKRGKVEVPVEKWELFKKTTEGTDEKLGFVEWTLEKEGKRFGVGFIGNQTEYDKFYTGKLPKNVESKYGGIGIRLNQFKIERFLQENFDDIEILSTGTAYPFHAKNGFKLAEKIVNDRKFPISQYDYIVEQMKNITRLDEKTIKTVLDKYVIKNNQETVISPEFANELYPLSYLQTGNKIFGDTPMSLSKEGLQFWKNLISKQSIL